jgi:single-strand DNA-binding protein
MSDTITVTGLVATTPRHIVTGEGLAITSFRLCSTLRRYDRTEGKWVDADTNWYSVATFRQLATNVVGSVMKGQRVVVTGRLRVREWETGDKRGTNVEIDADALGHDLSWGSAVFTRTVATAVATAESATADDAGPDVGADGSAEGESTAEPSDELAAARAQRATEVALPF